jgi:hypothetical protein
MAHVDTTDCIQVIITGNGTIEDDYAISLFPNPSSGKIRLSLPEASQSCTVEVLSISGQIIHSAVYASGATHELSIEKTGLYMIRIFEGAALKHTQLLVIQ